MKSTTFFRHVVTDLFASDHGVWPDLRSASIHSFSNHSRIPLQQRLHRYHFRSNHHWNQRICSDIHDFMGFEKLRTFFDEHNTVYRVVFFFFQSEDEQWFLNEYLTFCSTFCIKISLFIYYERRNIAMVDWRHLING